MADGECFIWRDQQGVHKIVPGRDGTKVLEEEFTFTTSLDEEDSTGAFSFERRQYRDLDGTKHDTQVLLKGNGVYEREADTIKIYWDKKNPSSKSLQETFSALTYRGDMTVRVHVDGEERVYV